MESSYPLYGTDLALQLIWQGSAVSRHSIPSTVTCTTTSTIVASVSLILVREMSQKRHAVSSAKHLPGPTGGGYLPN
eukprot:2912040-Rhodomonas_salina.1